MQGGYNVLGVDNLSAGLKSQVPAGVHFYKTDILNPKIEAYFKNVDTVFHLAAKNCISDCQSDPVTACQENVLGTVKVFAAAAKAGVRKVVYAESSALYEGQDHFPTDESMVFPESFYAVSKLSARLFAQAYRRYHKLNLTALRYFCVYGPKQDYRRNIPPVMSAFILNLLKNKQPIIYGTGQKRRDFIYVDDVNDFHLGCITDKRTDGETYNLGSGENHSVLEVCQTVSQLLGSVIKPKFQPDLKGEAEVTLANIAKAKSLGWSPKVSLREGLQCSLDFIRANVKL